MSRQPRVLDTLNNFFDELTVGDRYTTGERLVTAADIAAFTDLSGDRNALHTDPDYAERGPFGAIIAQGMCTMSLATGLEYEFYGDGERPTLAFYGMDRVRFTKPVFIGDTLHIDGEVVDLQAKDDTRGVVTYRQEIKNQRGETVVALTKRSLLKSSTYDAVHGSGG
jgi:3-hydroxybutyryl-CoA dehydratase